MNWGGSAIQSQQAGQAGYGLGQPLVVGDVGNAQYAGGNSGSGINWGGLLFSAAQGYNQANSQRQQPQYPDHMATRFGSPFENPGASAFSGLLSSHVDRARS